jgi:hypothetical protein
VLAFRIEIDGHSWQVAGVEDWEMLLLQLSAIRPRGDPEIEMDVHATFGADERGVNNVRWAKSPKLALGSQVTIKVVEADHADEPIRSYRYDADVQESPFTAEEEERMEREEWQRLKAKFEPDD